MTGQRLLRAAALILFCVALVAGYGAVRTVRDQVAAARVCEAMGAQRWEEAVELSEGLVREGPEGRITAECRCWALLAVGREAECAELVEWVLEDAGEEDGSVPPTLAGVAIRARRDRGELGAAAALARRATALHPAERDLLQLEFLTRGMIEGEASVLADFDARLLELEGQSLPLRLVLANARHRRGEFELALAVLGADPPDRSDPHMGEWFEARARVLASLGRLAGVVRTYERWVERGGDPWEIRARYALRVSQSGLQDPRRSTIELIRAVLATEERIPSKAVREALYHRLIGHLLADDRPDEALAVYDRARERFELRGLTRDQLLRTAELAHPDPESDPRQGWLEFRFPAEAIGGRLLVSPPPGASSDLDFEASTIPAERRISIARSVDVLPQRWVVHDSEGRTIGSGTAWPTPGRAVEIPVELRPALPAGRYRPQRRPGDGRRRIFVILPDCADWRLLQYLRARGELPVLDSLLASGYRAVLESTPPLTAAAMESLVWPGRDRRPTFLGVAHRLGLELAGLSSIGSNPLGFLSGLLPEAPNLFETVGAGSHVAANMLFAHGGIRAGRHAEIIGPVGSRRSVRSANALRLLTPEERTQFPGLTRHPRFVPLVETIAAELDAAIDLAGAKEVDLLMLRLEPLDILTHAHFHELTRSGQDDGDATLLWVYRYIDDRLARVHDALDEDDVLIFMSDHGIRTPMEHAEDAVFVAIGPGVPKGRAPGTPHLRGIPRVIADLLGVETGWPDTGIAPWAEGPPAAAEQDRVDPNGANGRDAAVSSGG